MKIREFEIDKDFDIIKDWITDERTHAMWSANHLIYPLDKGDLQQVLSEIKEMFGDKAFVAVTDEGSVVGFYCYSLNNTTNEGMLKFVVVSPQVRGKGVAGEMIKLALKEAFDNLDANAVHLNVFPENIRAKKFYEKIGFRERRTDENAFMFKDEAWGRCNMVISKLL